MERTTKRQLDFAVERLNAATGNALEPYTFNEAAGRHLANVGNYHIDHAYGGFQLCQMCNEGGGIRTIQPYRGTKGEAWACITAILEVINAYGEVR